MMFCHSRTFQWLLTAVLVVGTSVAGWPPVLAESAAVVQVSAESPARPCCCGMKAGACCGMGCCSAQDAPAPAPNPALLQNGSRGDVLPLGRPGTADSLPAGRQGHACGRGGAVLARSLAEATLQALHVRLDA